MTGQVRKLGGRFGARLEGIDFARSLGEPEVEAIADALHTHQVWPGDDDYVTMDFFRFDAHGKIVEHWDAMQAIPETSANGNTMY